MINKNEVIIASVTSFPARINSVHLMLESVLRQTLKADKVILWLSPEEFPNKEKDLPECLLLLSAKGLIIEWYKNIRSYKKLIPSLKKYPDNIIVTFDDDIIYNKRTIEYLYKCHKKHPKDIIAHRITRMYFKQNILDEFPRELYQYKLLKNKKYFKEIKTPSYFNKLTGIGGVLYPPGIFHKYILDEALITKLTPTNDDIWFWLQAVLNKVRVRVPQNNFQSFEYIPGTQDSGLSNINDKGENLFNIQLNNILSYYPELTVILQEDQTKNEKIIRSVTIKTKFLLPLVFFLEKIKCIIKNNRGVK